MPYSGPASALSALGKAEVAYFLKQDCVELMFDIEQFYNTQIEEMPMNVADLI